jgi:CubicO group peptidase (beta-lactamase class C family)
MAATIDALFAQYDLPDGPGASVIVIKDGRVLYKKAYGLADVEGKVRATTRTNYRLASVTKQFTAMSILILAERKQLTLDGRLSDFFPDFPAYGRSITIRQLLSHTSGLIAYEDLIPRGTTVPVKDMDVLHLLKQQTETYFPPGSRFRYSNSGYALLALIVEAVSRVSFAQFLKKNIFQPLGMKNTVALEEGVSTVKDRAYGYTGRSNGYKKTDQSLTSSVLGDGGIYSSVEDLYKWDQALYTTKLVGSDTLKQAFSRSVSIDGHSGYGFGWYIREHLGLELISHGGDTIGFKTVIERFPEMHFTVIILINRNDGDPSGIARKIADFILFGAEVKHENSVPR